MKCSAALVNSSSSVTGISNGELAGSGAAGSGAGSGVTSSKGSGVTETLGSGSSSGRGSGAGVGTGTSVVSSLSPISKAPAKASCVALATCFSFVVSKVGSTTGSLTIDGNSTFAVGDSGATEVGKGTGSDAVGSGMLDSFATGFGAGAGVGAGAEGVGAIGTLAEAATPLANVGTGSAWPATSSAASSSSATVSKDDLFASGWAKNDSTVVRYRVTSPLPPVA